MAEFVKVETSSTYGARSWPVAERPGNPRFKGDAEIGTSYNELDATRAGSRQLPAGCLGPGAETKARP